MLKLTVGPVIGRFGRFGGGHTRSGCRAEMIADNVLCVAIRTDVFAAVLLSVVVTLSAQSAMMVWLLERACRSCRALSCRLRARLPPLRCPPPPPPARGSSSNSHPPRPPPSSSEGAPPPPPPRPLVTLTITMNSTVKPCRWIIVVLTVIQCLLKKSYLLVTLQVSKLIIRLRLKQLMVVVGAVRAERAPGAGSCRSIPLTRSAEPPPEPPRERAGRCESSQTFLDTCELNARAIIIK